MLYLIPLLCWLLVGAAPPQVGSVGENATLQATGQTVRPLGRSLEFAGRPVDLALSPDGKTLYLKDDRGLVVVDIARWKITQELKLDGGTSMHGIAVRADSRRVYLTTAASGLAEGEVRADGKVTWKRQIALPGKGASYPCGIVLHPDGKRALVCLSRSNTLGIVDLAGGKLLSEIPVGIAPWGVTLTGGGRFAWVSNWGGRRPKAGELTALSAGTPTHIDARGIADSGTVSCVDIEKGVEIAQIETGLHPSDLVTDAKESALYVANANSDTVSVISTATKRVRETISVHTNHALPLGSAPNALTLSRDGRTLYVACGGNNAIAVISLGTGNQIHARQVGLIPTAWYPGAVITDGDSLCIANVKGIGSRSGFTKGWNVYGYSGTVQQAQIPTAKALSALTAQSEEGARLPQTLDAYSRGIGTAPAVPVPARVGDPSVFKHIVYIIKENRTYDQLFGDLKQGNGDAGLCIYGREVTPNHHALAEQFLLLDNFYCNGVCSADGHSWATEGNCTDHLEKAFGGFTRSYTFGDDPLTYSSSGFLWDNVLAHGLTFMNYGEMDYATALPDSRFSAIYEDHIQHRGKIKLTQNIGIENLRVHSCPDYPGWNMSIPDVLRADRFLKRLNVCKAQDKLENLNIVYLPNDHTGADISPRSYLADNDLALGRVIEGISKSKFWAKTCIFVVEDDPQAGWDHVDGHRSPCLVISPYTKRHAVVHEFYNQCSVLHTIEQILGLPPMNQMDAAAPLMTACFTDNPDINPYPALMNRVPILETKQALDRLRLDSPFWAALARKTRFDRPDASNEDALNRILWHQAKGISNPYPVLYAGPHGKGLGALGLRLTNEINQVDTETEGRRR